MTTRPTVIIGPTEEPISLAEAKAHLRVDGAEDDNDITDMIAAAREFCEERQAKAYYTQTLEITLDCWPCGNRIRLPYAKPLQSVTSLIYTDSTGTPATWSASNYIVDADSLPGGVVLAYGCSWPSVVLQPVNGVRIRYVAGHGAQSPPVAFPARIRRAMYWIIGHLYENREAATIGTLMESKELALGVADFLEPDEGIRSF